MVITSEQHRTLDQPLAPDRLLAAARHVGPEQLAPIRDLYDNGLTVDAYALARAIAPLTAWRGAAARVMAGRLAGNLGAGRLAYVLHRRAHEEDPADPEAIYYHARGVAERYGPLAAWELLRGRGATTAGRAAGRAAPELPGGSDELQADWLAFHGYVLGSFRDFEPAERYMAAALERAPEKPWVWVERAGLYEREDRYDDALAAARRALELRAFYRPAVQEAGHLLQLLDRDAEALDLLARAAAHVQSGPVVGQLALLQTELGMHAEARQSWDRVAELSPMADRFFERFLAARGRTRRTTAATRRPPWSWPARSRARSSTSSPPGWSRPAAPAGG
jgi:tetratricopeptide (TPR) repeat protein